MTSTFADVNVLKLCTENPFIAIINKVSEVCGLYTCCCCNAPTYTLCNTCRDFTVYVTPSCPICEKFSLNGDIHTLCKIPALYYTNALSCFYYTKVIKRLFHVYKYDGAFQYQRVIENLIEDYFRMDPFRLIDSLAELLKNKRVAFAPIPMTKRKQSDRGFSPAYEFMVIIARIVHKRFSQTIQLFPALLKKNDDKSTQARKSRNKRLLSLQRTYSVNESVVADFCRFNPEVLVVVDDVITTGATTTVAIDEIAKNEQLKICLKGKSILRFSFAQA